MNASPNVTPFRQDTVAPLRESSRWLMLAAEMAGQASSSWRPAPDAAVAGRAPDAAVAGRARVATRRLGPDAGSVRAARDFTLSTLHWWGTAERSQDIVIVVSELLTNALRHALPGAAATGGAGGATGHQLPIRLGLLQPGPFVLCAVADPSQAVPTQRTAGSLAETGRGLQIIRALSDHWGYTEPTDTGKVVWALFYSLVA